MSQKKMSMQNSPRLCPMAYPGGASLADLGLAGVRADKHIYNLQTIHGLSINFGQVSSESWPHKPKIDLVSRAVGCLRLIMALS